MTGVGVGRGHASPMSRRGGKEDDGGLPPYVSATGATGVHHGATTLGERRAKNPWVVYGALGTAAILVGGLISMTMGNRARSQMFMRARVVAQGATVGILMYSVAKESGAMQTGDFSLASFASLGRDASPRTDQRKLDERVDQFKSAMGLAATGVEDPADDKAGKHAPSK